jgi:hypothetical protein
VLSFEKKSVSLCEKKKRRRRRVFLIQKRKKKRKSVVENQKGTINLVCI